jgi:hypothetical protein
MVQSTTGKLPSKPNVICRLNSAVTESFSLIHIQGKAADKELTSDTKKTCVASSEAGRENSGIYKYKQLRFINMLPVIHLKLINNHCN